MPRQCFNYGHVVILTSTAVSFEFLTTVRLLLESTEIYFLLATCCKLHLSSWIICSIENRRLSVELSDLTLVSGDDIEESLRYSFSSISMNRY